MRWRTPITQLFGMRYPLLGGGLQWLSDASYVSALVKSGAMAFMTPRSFDSLDAFDAQLDACRDACGTLPFGVNLTLSGRPAANNDIPAQLERALARGVRHFETVGPSPRPLIERIHAAGGVVIHKCASIEHALRAEGAGADAIALVGNEAGGHPGMNPLPASVLCALALEKLTKPLAYGGGVGSGRQVAAALAMGCGAVVMGTRFLVGDELNAHERYKSYLVAQRAEASTMVLRSTGHPWRVLDNDTARTVREKEAAGASRYEDFGELVLGRTGRDGAYRGGDPQRGLLSMGPAVGFADRRDAIAAIVERVMAEAAQQLRGASQLLPRDQEAVA